MLLTQQLLPLQAVHGDAFRDLKIMVELDLSNNEIAELSSSTFTGNDRLQTLTLSHNSLTRLDAFQFPVLKHIKTIDLSYNSLQFIDVEAFGNLGSRYAYLHLTNQASLRLFIWFSGCISTTL